MNDLVESALAKDLDFIESCINLEEIINYLRKLDTIKYLLDKLPDNPKLAGDIAAGMRNRLLKAGAVGVGFDSGLYINPIPNHDRRSGDIESIDAYYWRHIESAIANRFKSICADLRKLHSLMEQSKIKLDYRDFISDSGISQERIDFYELSVTLMLADMGMIDKGDLEYKLDRSFEYKSNPYHSANTDGYKNGREYFLGELAKRAKIELENQFKNEMTEKERIEWEENRKIDKSDDIYGD